MQDFLRIETRAGSPVHINGMRLFPFANSLRFSISRLNLGFVWNRPISLLLIRPDGEEQVIPIRDHTRQIVWFLYGAIAILAAMTALIEFKMRGKK